MIERMEVDGEEVSKMAVTSVQVLIATVHKEGKIESRQEGRNEILLELPRVKFGLLSHLVITSVNALPDLKGHDLARKVLSAATPTDLTELGL